MISDLKDAIGKTLLAITPDTYGGEYRILLSFSEGVHCEILADFAKDSDVFYGIKTTSKPRLYLQYYDTDKLLRLGIISQQEYDEWHLQREKDAKMKREFFEKQEREQYERLKKKFKGEQNESQ